MRILLKALLFGVVIIVGVAAWEEWQKGEPSHPYDPAPQPFVPPATHMPQTPPSADLVIVGATGTRMQGQRMIQVSVRNVGSSVASGVSGVCSYRCVSTGVSVGNQAFLQNGYLVPGRVVNGLMPVTCPDQALHVQCAVDPGNAVPEASEANNTFAATVSGF